MAWSESVDHEEVLETLIDAMPEPFFVLDRNGRYLAVLGGRENDQYHDGSQLVGALLHEVLPAETADRFLAKIREALDNGRVISFEYELSADDIEGVQARPGISSALWFEAHLSPFAAVEGRDDMVVWTMSNITASKRAVERLEDQQYELERLARTDPLTGLLNRRSFFDEARRELQWVQRTGQPAALILFDLDRFKNINDTWGHAAGDAVLRALGELLRTRRRSTDVVARLGGEELAIVVRGAHLGAGRRLAERLRAEFHDLVINHDGQTVSVTASFGVTEIRATDADPEDTLKRADVAMYSAKRLGRDRVETEPPN